MKLIKYGAKWCNPCKVMTPIVQEFCKENNIELDEIDVDELSTSQKQVLNLKSVPTYDFVRGDGTVKRLNGMMSKLELKSKLGLE